MKPSLPGWPRAMRATLAAAYCGMSRTKFLKRARRLAVEDGGNRLFYREDLDQMLDELKGAGHPPEWGDMLANVREAKERPHRRQ